ncbi:MAG: alpha/beta hydrolase [Marmoricola sp.]|jgi:pimeloyl-ACP methyl ester carboxylesterase|nr:alpha/beta hydrolase [Marmoricola sp.]
MSIAVSKELFAPVAPGVELCYQTFGAPEGDPLVLVMGLGGPMTWWDADFCTMLAEAGFFVVRYDNRDTGRSTRVKGRVSRSALVKSFLGRGGRVPYTLDDMAADAFGLMDHLGWDSAHIAGVSMGGMIVQTMAINQPTRIRSVTSIMSTLGKRTVGWQHPSLLPMLLANRGAGREAYVASSAKMWKVIGSPGFPQTDEQVRARAEETFDRGASASGVMRQMLAILNQPNRSHALSGLRMPAAVVHGSADKMVHVSGGRATARAIPGAELLVIDGMGHDMPVELFETFVDIIRRTADRSSQASEPGRSA